MRSLSVVTWGVLCVLSTVVTSQAAEKEFILGGTNVVLQDASAEVSLFYSAMRFNRAQNVWNVEATLKNHSDVRLGGPIVLLVESFSGTTGPRQPDGRDDSSPALAWYDFTGALTNGVLPPNDQSRSRTLTLGFTNGTPQITARVYAKTKTSSSGLALTRTLNEVGQPLGGVTVVEKGAGGTPSVNLGRAGLSCRRTW